MSPERANEVAQVVEACCVTSIRDHHARCEEGTGTRKTQVKQILVGWNPDEFAEDACEKEWAHRYVRGQMEKRMWACRIRIHAFAGRMDSIGIPFQLIR